MSDLVLPYKFINAIRELNFKVMKKCFVMFALLVLTLLLAVLTDNSDKVNLDDGIVMEENNTEILIGK